MLLLKCYLLGRVVCSFAPNVLVHVQDAHLERLQVVERNSLVRTALITRLLVIMCVRIQPLGQVTLIVFIGTHRMKSLSTLLNKKN